MAPSNSSSEQALFEQWVVTQAIVRKYHAKLNKNRDGSYGDYRINDRWNAWMARAKIENQRAHDARVAKCYE